MTYACYHDDFLLWPLSGVTNAPVPLLPRAIYTINTHEKLEDTVWIEGSEKNASVFLFFYPENGFLKANIVFMA